MFRIAVVFLLVLHFYFVHSQTFVPKYANEYLFLGAGSRGFAMAGSVQSSVNDVTAAYWNPSLLIRMQTERQIYFMHNNYFAGLAKYDYGAVGFRRSDSSAFALSFIRFGVDDIPNTIDLVDAQMNIHYDRITTFSVVDAAVFLSYGRQLTQNISVGGSVKILRRRMGHFASAWGMGIDLSASYINADWIFSVVARDVTTTFTAWRYSLSDRMKEVFMLTGNEIPTQSLEITLPRFQFGAAKTFTFAHYYYLLFDAGFTLTTDGKRNTLIKTNLFSLSPHLGVELSYKKFIYVRGGVNYFQRETNRDGKTLLTFRPNTGIGLNIQNRFIVEYALTDLGSSNTLAQNSNVFSIMLSFNRPQQKVE